jgi:hypothetical protein
MSQKTVDHWEDRELLQQWLAVFITTGAAKTKDEGLEIMGIAAK